MITTLVIAGAIAARKRWLGDATPSALIEDGLIVIVGAGVAGLSAAVEALDRGARVLLIDKNARPGGNSQKATSGVNAAETEFQKALGIEDTAESFLADIEKSGKGFVVRSVARVLAERSGRVIDAAALRHKLDMSNVNALGGHSARRCHRFQPAANDPRPFGAVLVKTLFDYVKQFEEPSATANSTTAEEGAFARIQSFFSGTREAPQFVFQENTKLIDFTIQQRSTSPISSKDLNASPHSFWSAFSTPAGHRTPGSPESPATMAEENFSVPYVQSVTLLGPNNEERVIDNVKAVILAGGGFGGDTSSADSLIKKFKPEYAGLPTTNELTTTGDMHRLALKKGLATFELDQIQLHPTAFVCLGEMKNSFKFLCPEVVRSLGAILVNNKNERFIDELQTRDVVSAAIIASGGSETDWKIRVEQRLNDPAKIMSREQQMALLAFSLETGARFGEAALKFYISKQLIWPVEKLDEITGAFTAAELRAKHSNTTIDYVAFITPAVHYTTGGILTDELARCQRPRSELPPGFIPQSPVMREEAVEPIQNLFVVGEASGGLHGHNRLGGNGMAECMVYGALAGEMSVRASPVVKEFPTEGSDMVQSQVLLKSSPNRFTVTLPDLSTKLKKDARVDHLFAEAAHAGKEPIEFKDISITRSGLGLIELECSGDHASLSHGDKVVFHVSV